MRLADCHSFLPLLCYYVEFICGKKHKFGVMKETNGHIVLPDGSNATAADYFAGGGFYVKEADCKRPKAAVKTGASSLSRPLKVDLHIEALQHLKNIKATEALEYQLCEFRRVMDAHKRQKGKKIVFVHGKGDGVLRNALIAELKRCYKSCAYEDASFAEYGIGGALKVTVG